MKLFFPSTFLLCLLTAFPAAGQQEDPPIELKTTQQQASYAIGLSLARDLKARGFEVDLDAMMKGIRDVFADAEPSLSIEQARAALFEFQQQMQANAQEKKKVLGAKNQRQSELFLAENKKKDGVVTLPSGLQYKVLEEGTGTSPQLTDTVQTHYHGTLVDGTVFDSSVQRGEPATFPVGGVIRGWTEALQLMKVGSKWRLFVPPELAYGGNGVDGSIIGPNAALVFDVELLGIEQ